MSTAIARRPFNQAEFADKVLVDRVSLQMSETLTFQEFINLGRSLTEVGDSLAWWVGDWIEQGTVIYGGKYEEALKVMALDYQTLRKYALVARRFAQPSRRRESLSFAHHEVVASLEPADADAWLERAETERWSRDELREQLQTSRNVARRATDDGTRITLEQLKLTVPAERAHMWREAADDSGLSFEEWCGNALDAASMVG